MKKRILAVFLSGIMLATAFTGCGNSSESTEKSESAQTGTEQEDENANETTDSGFKIGYVSLDTTGSFFGNAYSLFENICDAAGCEIVSDIGAFSPEEQVNSVQNVISAGVSAICFINFTEDCLPKIADLCDDAEVYWGQFARDIADPEVKEYLENSEYYVGRCYCDDTFIALKALEKFQEEGIQKVAIVGPATGDVSTDTRDNYFQEHADEYGIEVLVTVRDLVDASSAKDAVSNIIATYPDIEGLYCISGSDSRGEGCFSAIEALGKQDQIKVVMSDFIEGMDKYFDSGMLLRSFGGSFPVSLFITAELINKVTGHSLSDEPVSLLLPYIMVDSSEEFNEYYKYCEEEPVYTTEEAKELLGMYNEELDLDTLTKHVIEFSLEDVKTRHAE
jgi:ABC-type sugar transport system substrate-binding protein